MATLNQFEKDGTTYDIEDTTARNKKAVVVNTQKSGAEIGSVDGFKLYSPKITPTARQTSGYEIGSVSVDSAKTTFYAPKVGDHFSIDLDYGNGRRIATIGVDNQTYNVYLPPSWEKISTKNTTAGWNWVPINWDKYLEVVMLLTGAPGNNSAIFHYNDSSTPTCEYIDSGNYIAQIQMGSHPVAIVVKKIDASSLYLFSTYQFLNNNNSPNYCAIATTEVTGIGFGSIKASQQTGGWGNDVGVGATVTLYGRY